MNYKNLGLALAWFASVVVATCIATHAVMAQQLVPPPPVLSVSDPGLSRIEIKLDAIERRQRVDHQMIRALWVKHFPLKMEQSTMDAPMDSN